MLDVDGFPTLQQQLQLPCSGLMSLGGFRKPYIEQAVCDEAGNEGHGV
jgi:hypothetical protein